MRGARLILLFAFLPGFAGAEGSVSIPAGTFRPQFGAEGQDLPVATFRIDRESVTNADFAAFLKKNPDWARGRAQSEQVDGKYLAHWVRKGKGWQPKAADRNRPLTGVSWFAAQAFCEQRGGRLPTTLEWEYAAAASKDQKDATKDPKFQEQILVWYSTRGDRHAAAETNLYGVRGMHGRVWEWTSDFNAFFVTADNRQDGDQSKNFFCGAGSTNAANKEEYAAFMRYALRSSLQANFTLESMGFRCAYDHE